MATIRTIYINMRSIEVNCIHIYLDLSISLLPLGNRTPFLIPLCNFLLSLMSSDNPKDPFTVWMLFDFTPSTLHIYILKHNKTSVVQPRGKLPGCQKHDGPLHRWSLAFGIIFRLIFFLIFFIFLLLSIFQFWSKHKGTDNFCVFWYILFKSFFISVDLSTLLSFNQKAISFGVQQCRELVVSISSFCLVAYLKPSSNLWKKEKDMSGN